MSGRPSDEEQLGRGKRERRQVLSNLGNNGAGGIAGSNPGGGGVGATGDQHGGSGPSTTGGAGSGGAGGRGYDDGTPCHVCGGDDDRENLLLCDGCTAGAHTMCLGLSCAPPGKWYCGGSGAHKAGTRKCVYSSYTFALNTHDFSFFRTAAAVNSSVFLFSFFFSRYFSHACVYIPPFTYVSVTPSSDLSEMNGNTKDKK